MTEREEPKNRYFPPYRSTYETLKYVLQNISQNINIEQNKNKILERLEYCYAAVAEFWPWTQVKIQDFMLRNYLM